MNKQKKQEEGGIHVQVLFWVSSKLADSLSRKNNFPGNKVFNPTSPVNTFLGNAFHSPVTVVVNLGLHFEPLCWEGADTRYPRVLCINKGEILLKTWGKWCGRLSRSILCVWSYLHFDISFEVSREVFYGHIWNLTQVGVIWSCRLLFLGAPVDIVQSNLEFDIRI